MKRLFKIALLCIFALLLGLTSAIPLLESNFSFGESTFVRPFIELDVSYAYFSLPSYSQNVIGLSDNNQFTKGSMIDCIFIANITNYSKSTVSIDGITLFAASLINTTNTKSEFSQHVVGSFLTQRLGFNPYADMVTNSIRYLGPYQSKLVALSGTTELGSSSETLQTGNVYLGGFIDGSIQDWHSTWGNSKQVQMQHFENEYLYNGLVLSNQTLHLQGNDVYIK